MIAVRNPHAVVRLARTMIQHVPRGATPSRYITAPPSDRVVHSMISEQERLSQFEASSRIQNKPAAVPGRGAHAS